MGNAVTPVLVPWFCTVQVIRPNLLRKTPINAGCDLKAPCGGSASCSWFCVGGIYCPGGKNSPPSRVGKKHTQGMDVAGGKAYKYMPYMQVKILYTLLGLCYISHGAGWYVVWTRGWRHSINTLLTLFFCIWWGCRIIATSINIYQV